MNYSTYVSMQILHMECCSFPVAAFCVFRLSPKVGAAASNFSWSLSSCSKELELCSLHTILSGYKKGDWSPDPKYRRFGVYSIKKRGALF
jgi:hypothetical protein